MAEKYFNNFQTTVAIGGYTAGSGQLDVASTTGITLSAGDTCRLLVYRIISGVATPIVLLKATAVNSSTQFAAVAEGSDANALVTDIVINVNSAAGMDQIRADLSRSSSGSLPTDGRKGDIWLPTDDNVFHRHNGSAFLPFGPIAGPLTNPRLTTFAWRNQGAASVIQAAGSEFILAPAAAGDSWKCREITAPATPWTITVCVLVQLLNVNFQQGGLFVCDGTKLITLAYAGGTPGFRVDKWNSVTSISANTVQAQGPNPGFMWLRVTDDGTDVIWYFSLDGINFFQLATAARGAWLTTGPTSVGFAVESNNSVFDAGIKCISWKQT